MERRLPVGRGLVRGRRLTIHVDGRPLPAFEGETVAAALIAAGIGTLRHTDGGQARGVFCAMGVCFDCLVTVDGVESTRACMTWVGEGMEVATRRAHGDAPDG